MYNFGSFNLLFSSTHRLMPLNMNFLMKELAKTDHSIIMKKASNNSEINKDIVKELHPNKTNRIILVFLIILCVIEFILFIINVVKKKRNNKSPLFTYLIIKIVLFCLMLFYNDFKLEFIVPTVKSTGETQLINFGDRLFVQIILHSAIYVFISIIHTSLLLSVYSSELEKPKYFRVFITTTWFFALFGNIKELFIYQIELNTRYYKHIHVIVYFVHSSLIFFYKYFLIKSTTFEFWSILISCICYSFSILSYVLFSKPNFFTKCFYPFVYLGSLIMGFTMWNRFLYSDSKAFTGV